MGNTILAKGVNHILAKRDNSAWPKGSKLSGISTMHGVGGEQVFGECTHALLLQRQIPQGMGEYRQSFQRNMGGRHSR